MESAETASPSVEARPFPNFYIAMKNESQPAIPPSRQRWKVLIADDEPTITDTYAAAFTRAGIDSEKAYDGKECLDKATSSVFNLILVDIRMPGVDGYEVIRRLRLLPRLKRTPIVILTGLDDSRGAIETGYAIGATEFWRKPIPTEELVPRARALLRAADTERKARTMQESFMGMIVHDLRGPLSAIVGFAELIAEEKEEVRPEIATMAVEINQSGRLMLSIIDDFYEITRYESEDMHLSKRPVALLDVINNSLQMHKLIQEQKTIAVTVECGAMQPLMLDAQQMTKVVAQVLDNAFRFTPPQGSIAISAHGEAPTVTLEITDSGAGIPESDLPMLFDKMRIVTPGSKRQGSRTGLGLPICRAIVEAHGGTISASSTSGAGTTIRITLPSD